VLSYALQHLPCARIEKQPSGAGRRSRGSSGVETATPLPGRIAFTDLPKVPGHYLVYTIAPDGGARTPVTTPPPAADDQHARFSPDGSEIPFDRGAGMSRIVVVNTDGTGLHQQRSVSRLANRQE
jgi:hypothetical protein